MAQSPLDLPQNPRRKAVRIVLLGLLFLAFPAALLVACQARLIYFPRPYEPGTVADWQGQTGGRVVEFHTSQGQQRAFLQGDLTSPRNMWICCGGNGTVALEWSEWLMENAPPGDAWLLVDFPGYGASEGAPSPARIQESMAGAGRQAFQELGWPETGNQSRLRFFGHSLGAAACLIAASEFEIQRGVLIAPFTSTMEMSRKITGLPIGFLVWHRFDNQARLAELAARGVGSVEILHGSDDRVIPSEMGRKLAEDHPELVKFTEIPGAGHNSMQSAARSQLAVAMQRAAE